MPVIVERRLAFAARVDASSMTDWLPGFGLHLILLAVALVAGPIAVTR